MQTIIQTRNVVRQKNTAPELEVQRIARELGLRFDLHRSDLPGTTDLVFPLLHLVVFVNGCFWHQHSCRHVPKTNSDFWRAKIQGNIRLRPKEHRTLEASRLGRASYLGMRGRPIDPLRRRAILTS